VFNRVGLLCGRLGRPYLSTEIKYKYANIICVAGGCALSVIMTSARSGLIVCG
jgi:hypothetical protein